MGAWYTHKCDQCDYEVHTEGPWEFYKDKNGRRKRYGHPGPASEEAAKQGIAGLTGKLYCPKCDKVSVIILVEFKKPTTDSMEVWGGIAEPADEYQKEGAVKCPKCGNTELLFGDEDNMDVKCPRCNKGKFISFMTMIS